MAPPLMPASRLRDGLLAVRESIEDFANAYRIWLTEAPSYSSAPSLFVSNTNTNPTSSASTNCSLQPDAETLARAYCPVAGSRWDEHRVRIAASTSIKGLSVLRSQVDAELSTLERIATENGSWDEPHPYSNGTHHIGLWEEIIYVALMHGPIVSLQDRFSFNLSTAIKRKRKLLRSHRGENVNSHSVKIDIVAQAGDRWTRLYIIKPERLRQEFREAESYMVDDEESGLESNDDDNDNDADLAASATSSATVSGHSFYEHQHTNSCRSALVKDATHASENHSDSRTVAFDAAAQRCSLMKLILQLRAAAETESQARVQRSKDLGRPPSHSRICIEIVVTRIQLQVPIESLPATVDGWEAARAKFYQLSEWDRFNHRLAAIVQEAKKLSIDLIFGLRQLPPHLIGPFEYPSTSFARLSSRPVGLPRVSSPPKRPEWRTTSRINLDVTAMIALVSDTTHGHFHESIPSEAMLAGSKRHPRVEHGAQGSGLKYQHHFRTFSIRKEALEARAAELLLQDDQHDEATRALDHAAAKEGRALAIQLEREKNVETLFDAILNPIWGRQGNRGFSTQQIHGQVDLFATVGAFDRLRRVCATVGGPKEKARVAALLGDEGTDPMDFWKDSSWSGSDHAKLRDCLQLPIKQLQDLGPGGFDTLTDLRQIYPDLPRAHFMSHMIDTLESCLSEVWGRDWRDISEDLPRSKYKKLKQSSVHQAGGQTYTTLRSMHACARYGMTSLTSNMDSIQWLLKEMSRRPYSIDTRSILERETPADLQRLQHSDEPFFACFIVLHPRSLSEQMRVTTTAPPWREVLAGYPGGVGPPVASLPPPERVCENEIRIISDGIETQSYRKPTFSCASVKGYTIDDWDAIGWDHSGTATVSHSRDPFSGSLSGVGASKASILPVSDQRSSNVGGSQSSKDSKYIPMTPLGLEPEVEPIYSYESNAMRSNSDQPEPGRIGRRTRGARKSIGRWLMGPRPPAKLSIRYYKWWPFAQLERAWTRITNPVAWKDPLNHADHHPHRHWDSDPRRQLQEGEATESARPEEAPSIRWLRNISADVRLNKIHWIFLCLVYVAWIFGFAFLAKSLWYESNVVGPDGTTRTPAFLSCTATYWLRNAGCGLNGQDCAPFYTGVNDSGQAFRCPAQCNDVSLLNPRSIGSSVVNYEPLIVGGGDDNKTYRGDSFICAAAIHAGVIRNSVGGCGLVRLVGAQANYQAKQSNGLTSVGFDSVFPSSFRFEAAAGTSNCTDRRWQGYLLNVIMTAFVGFVLRPKRMVWFWTLACVGFWHINLVSEPRDYPPPVGDAVGDFLPFLFCCYVMYRLAFRFVWPAFANMPIERTFWTLGLWWVGVLMNVVFSKVPIQRLVARDIAQQPGSLTALIIIIGVVIVIAVNQVRVMRKTGNLPKYLILYAVGGVLIALATAVPGEALRIHHYIIALALLPACAFPTRLSLIYLGFLLGMFTNGIARWGFDGLLQDTAVVQGDATGGTALPSFNTTNTTWSASDQGVFTWNAIPQDQRSDYDGFNLLIDDVLRYEGTGTSFNLSTLPDLFAQEAVANDQTILVTDQPSNRTILDSPHYLRLAYTSQNSPGDFTMAAIAFLANNTWVSAPEGAS